MMKITPKQAERIRRLVKSLCANCDESGSCLLLDDGEGHKCLRGENPADVAGRNSGYFCCFP